MPRPRPSSARVRAALDGVIGWPDGRIGCALPPERESAERTPRADPESPPHAPQSRARHPRRLPRSAATLSPPSGSAARRSAREHPASSGAAVSDHARRRPAARVRRSRVLARDRAQARRAGRAARRVPDLLPGGTHGGLGAPDRWRRQRLPPARSAARARLARDLEPDAAHDRAHRNLCRGARASLALPRAGSRRLRAAPAGAGSGSERARGPRCGARYRLGRAAQGRDPRTRWLGGGSCRHQPRRCPASDHGAAARRGGLRRPLARGLRGAPARRCGAQGAGGHRRGSAG